MPIHDWTKVDAGIFHDFHGDWIQVLKHTLNGGVLPPNYYALSEQKAAGVGPDILTLQGPEDGTAAAETGLLVAEPKVRIVETGSAAHYRRKQRRLTIRHSGDDRVVAVIEIVSPGNKNSKNPFRSFLDKAAELVRQGIHLLVIDLHPHGKNDPDGVHAAIWEELGETPQAVPSDKPLTVASYQASTPIAYVEPVAVGDALPEMPLYLIPGGYVNVPLERTYQAAWQGVPARWRTAIDPTS